ncbi:hypothetical protein EDC01DRAFT_759314 [Geopyxis carbonaria]|nr:hypothetical protein EDC01DRAFT_759314 [Geopyxis carbonaria]
MLSILTPRSTNSTASNSNSTTTTTTTKPTSPTATPVADAATAQAKIAFLNQALETLHDVFPSGEVDEFRRLLKTTPDESRLYVVTEMLLKRYKDAGCRARAGPLEPWERFRSDEYRAAVKKALCKEFRGLPKSTIQAVMAENNDAYAPSRTTLAGIAAKSWRVSFSNLFRRAPRAPPAAVSGCRELDDELHALAHPARDAQAADDAALAQTLNEAEAAAAGALVECECCYGDFAWENIAACTAGHFFCHACLTRAVQEGVYGQGRAEVRCLSATAAPACVAAVAPAVLAAALPADVKAALEERAACDSLERSGLRFVRCPFCGYAEVDEPRPLRPRPAAVLAAALALLLAAAIAPRAIAALVAVTAPLLLLYRAHIHQRIVATAHTLTLRRRGTRFRCAAPACLRASCLTCLKPFAPFHICFEAETDGARLAAEKAMADAVKRTCPRCNTSFIKSSGCNKLTCPCGYVMCYICRADVREVGYAHFCQHFRQVPGRPCAECRRCDLYVVEDETEKVRRAGVRGEEAYWTRVGGRPGAAAVARAGVVGVGVGVGIEGWGSGVERGVEWVLEKTVAACFV